MTDPTNPDAQLDRLQQLQRRRAAAGSTGAPMSAPAAPSTHRRIAPATGAKIATAGFFTATMLGMVGAMAISEHAMSAAANTTPATNPTTAPATTAPPKVIVVVHHVDANGKPLAAPTVKPSGKGTPAAAAPAPVAVTAPPIALTAAPVVQRVPAAAAAAPVARSSGSRH
jgi:hypothetical protein